MESIPVSSAAMALRIASCSTLDPMCIFGHAVHCMITKEPGILLVLIRDVLSSCSMTAMSLKKEGMGSLYADFCSHRLGICILIMDWGIGQDAGIPQICRGLSRRVGVPFLLPLRRIHPLTV